MNEAANFNVALATNLLELGKKEEAYDKLHQAADILEKEASKSKFYRAADDYVYALGVSIQSLCSDGPYREAIAMLPRYEKAMDCLTSKTDIPEGLTAKGAWPYGFQ